MTDVDNWAAATGYRYQRAMLNPGVAAVGRGGAPVLFRWASEPQWGNSGGAVSRVSPAEAWAAVRRGLAGDLSRVEGSQPRTRPWFLSPLWHCVILANGYGVQYKGFALDAQGKENILWGKGIRTGIPLALLKFFIAVRLVHAFLTRAPVHISIPVVLAYVVFWYTRVLPVAARHFGGANVLRFPDRR